MNTGHVHAAHLPYLHTKSVGVLEAEDSYLIDISATPSKQTLSFFNQNLVMEYGGEQTVAELIGELGGNASAKHGNDGKA